MKSKAGTLSRRELYEKVWASPVTEVAKELGLSDNGVRKLCVRNNVPCPPRGYWAKLQAGKRVTKIKLPAAAETRSGTIERTPRPPRPGPSPSPQAGTVPDATPQINQIFSRAPGAPRHPLVLTTLSELKDADETIVKNAFRDKQRRDRQLRGEPWEPDFEALNRPQLIDHGRVRVIGGFWHCLVSPQLRTRAVDILEKLLLTGEANGFTCGMSIHGIELIHNGERADIRLFEALEKRRNPSSDEFDKRLRPVIDMPSGKLNLTIQAPKFFSAIRASDEPRKPLEHQVATVLTRTLRGLSRMPAKREADRIKQEELALKREVAAQQAEDAAARRRIKEEQERRERERQTQLFEDATLWGECERARLYIAEVLRLSEEKGPDAAMKAKRWANWAMDVVAAKDPAQKSLSDSTGDSAI